MFRSIVYSSNLYLKLIELSRLCGSNGLYAGCFDNRMIAEGAETAKVN